MEARHRRTHHPRTRRRTLLTKTNSKITRYTTSRDLTPVGDYRPLLKSAGFDVLAYEETPGWADRVEAAFSAIVGAADVLAEEMGEQASASALAEAMITLDTHPYPRRILAVAGLPR